MRSSSMWFPDLDMITNMLRSTSRNVPMTFDQCEYDIRCEWGAHGLRQLGPGSDAVIIVDVLSFSTCVSIATSRGALVFPYACNDDTPRAYARSMQAELAGPRGTGSYSLSPRSLLDIPPGTRLVLPSPNGATLTLATGHIPTLAGCLRNCRAVAEAAMHCGRRIAVIPAGEQWSEDGSLRFALEDWLGAGAIMAHLRGSLSPEARAAVAGYHAASDNLLDSIERCGSGQELCARGFARDIALAAQVDVDDCAPVLRHGAYVKAEQDTTPDGDAPTLHPRG
jgi:2-phosphosulfolactate phosphatase